MPVVNRIAEFAEDMKTWRRHIHAHPELGLDCFETAKFVVERLKEMGVDEIHEGIAQSGVVAVINGQGDGPVTALRADMDALPMPEETGVDYASTVEGKMHACGHDGHTTMLLGAARYLAETRKFKGKVVLLFQPAEETIGGGRIMVEDEKVMDRFGVEEVYGIHTDPTREPGAMSSAAGPILAAADEFTITITGKGSHAAHPYRSIDPVPAALALGQALMTIPARNVNPLDSIVVSLTMVNVGTAYNVIPEVGTMCGTVRSFAPEVRALAQKRITEICEGIATSFGVRVDLDFELGYPPTVNHPAQTEFAGKIAQEVSGNVDLNRPPQMGAEDFSYMLEARPGAFFMLGQGGDYMVHHPKFNFNDDVAPIGSSFFVRLIETRHAL